MSEDEILDEVTKLSVKDPRYPREALMFVLNGIHWAFARLGTRRHLSGEEFTELLIAFAREEFGDFASTVFREWGIFQTSDLGEIVYILIDADLLSRQEDDSIEDFEDVLDLERALNDPDFSPRISS